MARNTRRKANPHSAQTRMAGILDDITQFEEFKASILPVLRDALKQGLDADTIYKKFQAYAAARAISIAATEVDSSKALSAIKDILDRTQGRAKERTEVTHKLSSLPEEQLDAILLSKLKDQSDSNEEKEDERIKH